MLFLIAKDLQEAHAARVSELVAQHQALFARLFLTITLLFLVWFVVGHYRARCRGGAASEARGACIYNIRVHPSCIRLS